MTDEVVQRLENVEQQLLEIKRTAESTRTIAMIFLVLFIGVPVILMILGIGSNLLRVYL